MFKIGKCGCCGSASTCTSKDVTVSGLFYGFGRIMPASTVEEIDQHFPLYRTIKLRFEYTCIGGCGLISGGETGWRESVWQCTRDGVVTKISDNQSSGYRSEISWTDTYPEVPITITEMHAESSKFYGVIIHGYDDDGAIVTAFEGFMELDNVDEQDDANVRNIHDTFTIEDSHSTINFETNVLTAGSFSACPAYGTAPMTPIAVSCWAQNPYDWAPDLSTILIPMDAAPEIYFSTSVTAAKSRRCANLAACLGQQVVAEVLSGTPVDLGTFWEAAGGSPTDHFNDGIVVAPPVLYRRVVKAFIAWSSDAQFANCASAAVAGDDPIQTAIVSDDGTIIIN